MGPKAGLDGCGTSRLRRGFDPGTVQPVASRYTDWAIPAQMISYTTTTTSTTNTTTTTSTNTTTTTTTTTTNNNNNNPSYYYYYCC